MKQTLPEDAAGLSISAFVSKALYSGDVFRQRDPVSGDQFESLTRRALCNFQDYLSPCLPALIEFVGFASFGQRQHSLDHRLELPSVYQFCNLAQNRRIYLCGYRADRARYLVASSVGGNATIDTRIPPSLAPSMNASASRRRWGRAQHPRHALYPRTEFSRNLLVRLLPVHAEKADSWLTPPRSRGAPLHFASCTAKLPTPPAAP